MGENFFFTTGTEGLPLFSAPMAAGAGDPTADAMRVCTLEGVRAAAHR